MLAGGEVDYQGRVFRASAGMRLNLEPERPAVPIYLATMAPKAVELTGEVADGWIPFGGEPAAVSRGMAHIRRAAGGPQPGRLRLQRLSAHGRGRG